MNPCAYPTWNLALVVKMPGTLTLKFPTSIAVAADEEAEEVVEGEHLAFFSSPSAEVWELQIIEETEWHHPHPIVRRGVGLVLYGIVDIVKSRVRMFRAAASACVNRAGG